MKAQQFVRKLKKEGLHEQGWSGSFWEDEDCPDGQVVLECTREGDGSKTVTEVILQAWEGAIWVAGKYKVAEYGQERNVKNAAEALRLMAQSPARVQREGKRTKLTGNTRRGRAAPDFSGMTDQEVLDTLYGQTITFARSLDGVEETITIPPKTREVEDSKGKLKQIENDITTHRIVNFIGGGAMGKQYRAVNLNNITSIG